MNESYKDVLIDNIIKDYETEGASLYEIAKKYNFPSLKILQNVVKKYYKKESKIDIDKIDYFSHEEKEEIFRLFKYYNHSLKQLSLKYMTTITVIRNTIEEFQSIKDIIAQRHKDITEIFDIDINIIIDELNTGKTYSYITKKYGISYEKLKVLLSKSEAGMELIKKRKEKNKRKVIIPIDEIVKALKNGNLKELKDKYGVSETTLRNKLRKEYGEHYIYILETDKRENDNYLEQYGKAYEEGYTYDEIAKMQSVSPEEAKENVIKYYKRKKEIKPRVLTKSHLTKYLQHHSIEQLIDDCNEQNIIIPQNLLDTYVKKQGEVDIHKIKTIVHEQLAKLKDEGMNPNYINPFKLANSLKQHGYGTSYQACAILYSLINENDLSIDILKQIDSQELSEAVITLLNKENINKVQFLQMLGNNKIAYAVYKEENNLIKDDKDNHENRSE